MRSAPLPHNEQERLSALYEYNILDTLPEKEFDDITRIASEICHTPISLVSIIDEGRQWFKSKIGLNAQETPRDIAFCAHAILNPTELFIIPDSSKDERFSDNPLVTGSPHVAFYAGIPLVTDSGQALGTLCVLDNKPKDLDESQRKTLRSLANQVVALLELKHKSYQLARREAELLESNSELERFAYVAAHDLKSPCNQITALATLLLDESAHLLPDTKEMVSMMDFAAHNMKSLIEGILRHSRIAHSIKQDKEHFTFGQIIQEVKNLLPLPQYFTLKHGGDDVQVWSIKTVWLQIVLNLASNAVKYNDKEDGYVDLRCSEDEKYYRLSVADNGVGIPVESQGRIFDLFETVHDQQLFPKESSTGIGLHTVKKLVEKLDGKIRIMSEVGIGTTFSISIRK